MQPSVHQTRQSGTTGQQGLGTPEEAKSSSKFHSAFLTRTLSLAADGITQGPSEEAISQGEKWPVMGSCGYLGPQQFQTRGTVGGSASPICTLLFLVQLLPQTRDSDTGHWG